MQSFYARRNDGPRTVLMHSAILGCEAPDWGDHRDGNTLNNRRTNLRNVSPTQNAFNRRVHCTNESGFKGVHLYRKTGKWAAQIQIDGQKKFLGYHESAEAAAQAYDAAARELHGEFAKLNGV
jgi:hypothetical protein